MGRSSRSRAEENRARIVEVASGLFRARGLDSVGIAEIMKAAGMTQGGFYKHFPSKDALAAEACAFAFTTAAETWRRVAQDAARGVRGLFDTFAELAAADGFPAVEDRLRTLFAAMVGSNMLARSGHGEGWSTSFKQSVVAAGDNS